MEQVAPSGLSIVQPDTVAITSIRNATRPVAALAEALSELTTLQQKTIAMNDAQPLWITVEFMILVIDLEGSGSTTTAATLIQTLQSNCDSAELAPGHHVAFDGYLLWGCLSGLTETTYVLQSQLGESTGENAVITIGWTEIVIFLFTCLGCCYGCVRVVEWKQDRQRGQLSNNRAIRRAANERQAAADAAAMSAYPTDAVTGIRTIAAPSMVDAVSVVSAVPVAVAQPAPMFTAGEAVVTGAHATAQPLVGAVAVAAPGEEPASWAEMNDYATQPVRIATRCRNRTRTERDREPKRDTLTHTHTAHRHTQTHRLRTAHSQRR